MNSRPLPDHYATLDLPNKTGSTETEIKTAYRRLALAHHPDKNYSSTTTATEIFKQISLAYEILSDVAKRQGYDREYIRIHRPKESFGGRATMGRETGGFSHTGKRKCPACNSFHNFESFGDEEDGFSGDERLAKDSVNEFTQKNDQKTGSAQEHGFDENGYSSRNTYGSQPNGFNQSKASAQNTYGAPPHNFHQSVPPTQNRHTPQPANRNPYTSNPYGPTFQTFNHSNPSRSTFTPSHHKFQHTNTFPQPNPSTFNPSNTSDPSNPNNHIPSYTEQEEQRKASLRILRSDHRIAVYILEFLDKQISVIDGTGYFNDDDWMALLRAQYAQRGKCEEIWGQFVALLMVEGDEAEASWW